MYIKTEFSLNNINALKNKFDKLYLFYIAFK